MSDIGPLAPDASAIILLCSSIGAPPGSVRPFGPTAWARLSDQLLHAGPARRPRDLIGLTGGEIARSIDVDAEEAERIAALLARAGQLAFELDRLQSRGIWVVTIADDTYPGRLRDRLGPAAPPVLFGSGPAALLSGGGVAIVGSREADAAAIAFTQALATAVAAGGSTVVSGGARGVDLTAMRAAFEAGGAAIGVLPEGVERRLRDPSIRAALAAGRGAMVSPYHPAAPFSVGAATGRNKLIYALADVAVVVSSADGSGGTWSGAVEALKAGWVPVLVRDDADAPAGNRSLVALGAAPLSSAAVGEVASAAMLLGLAGHLGRVGRVGRADADAAVSSGQQRLFDDLAP